MSLAELQRKFSRYLLTGEAGELALQIRSSDLSPLECLSIYRNNFLIGLSDALFASFPVVAHILGQEFMRQCAEQFVLRHSPRSPRLMEYGAEFPDFLAGLASLSRYPYVPEMAEFEWRRVAVWDARSQLGLSATDLAIRDPMTLEHMDVRLADHAVVMAHFYPLKELWTAHQVEQPDPSGVDMSRRPRFSLIWRSEARVDACEIGEREARFLAALHRPTELGGAISAFFGEEEGRAQRFLTFVLSERLLLGND
jgi:hypothetical protein